MKNYLIILLILVVGCRPNLNIETTPLTYGLKGNIISFSEEKFTAFYNDKLDFIIDTTNPYYILTNKIFNDKGIISKIEYFDKDSTLLSKVIYQSRNNPYSIQYNKNDFKNSYSRLISFEDSISVIETVDSKTNVVTSKSWTKIQNGRIDWMKSLGLKDSLYSEWNYKRNDKGLETEIKTKFGYDPNQDYRTVKIKYLEFDEVSNWTKRIEFNPDEGNSCMVIIRSIKYKE